MTQEYIDSVIEKSVGTDHYYGVGSLAKEIDRLRKQVQEANEQAMQANRRAERAESKLAEFLMSVKLMHRGNENG